MDASFHQLDDAKARAVHLLTCPLCTNQYTDPRVLPCQHTFCCRCLSAHVGACSSSRLGAFRCPVCLADVGLPAAGAAAFPVDERIRSIRELVVDEMAKDLASRIKGRTPHGNAVCNGDATPGTRRGATTLDNITERPGVDDEDDADVDCGTWPSSSARSRHVGDQSAYRRTATADDPVFDRQRPGYSSVRGVSRTRRTRAGATPNGDNDAPLATAAFGPSPDARFGRERPGYSSMRGAPRTRPASDDEAQSMFDGVGRSQGRTASSGCFFGNRPSSSQTGEPARATHQRAAAAAHVDASSPSPFDNINRDDDEPPYTPKIGRNRLAYSSLREMRRRPAFDPTQLYESPPGFVDDDESPGPVGPGRLGSGEARANHGRRADFQSRDAHDASEFDESLRPAGSGDRNRTRYASDHSAREQKLPEDDRERESQQGRPGGRDQWTAASADSDARFGRERPGYSSVGGVPRRRQAADSEPISLDDSISRSHVSNRLADTTARQRPDSDDTPVLTVLSNLPADMKTAVASNVPARAATSASDQSQTRLDCRSDEAVHDTDAPRSPVPSVPHRQNDVASHFDLDKTDDVANAEYTEPSTSCSADISKDANVTVADNPSPCSPDMFTPASANESAETAHGGYQADFVAYKQCSPLEEAIYSPPRSPNESCFSHLTKFRSSKNSRQSASSTFSTRESASKETDNPSSPVDTGTVPSPKPRARKRPPAFLGTPFNFTSGSRADAATTPPSVVRSDELNSESCNREHETDGQFELQRPSVSDSQVDRVCSDDRSTDVDVKGGLQSISSDQTAGVEDFEARVDVSPTAEAPLPPGAESDDVQTDVSTPRYDDDSAMYSAGVMDSDASLRSATEPCLPTPTTDDDDDSDDLLDRCAVDEPAATDVIRCRPRDDEGPSTTVTDFDVERHQDDPVLIGEVPSSAAVEDDDVEGDDDGGSASTCSGDADEQNDEPRATDSEHVNDDDVATSNNRSATERREEGESGYRTSLCGAQTDDVVEPDCGYVLVTGVAALGDGSLVAADYGAASVCLCDDEGRAEHRVTGLKPFSVAAASTSDDVDQLIYVGDRRRKTLLALDRHGADVAQWPDNQFDWVCGVACLPDGHVAVIDRSRTRQLGVYAPGGDDGRPLAELGGHGSSLGDLCMAEFVAADSRGRLLVADSGNHCVKAFDRRVPKPGVVAVYGTTRGSGDAQLQWPKGVAVDSADNVLVADRRNGRVVAFSVDGRPLGSVVPAVRGPFAVCTPPTSLSHPRRRLAVASSSIGGLSEFRLYDYSTDEILV